MQYADEIGPGTVLAGMNHYREQLAAYGEMWFKPAPLLEKLAGDQVKLAEFIPPYL